MCVVELTSNVPDVQFETVVHQRLDIKTLCWRHVSDAFFGQFLQNRRLSSVVQTKHQNTCLLVRPFQLTQQ